LWGIIKEDESQKRYQTTEELKVAVRNTFAEIAPAIRRQPSSYSPPWEPQILLSTSNVTPNISQDIETRYSVLWTWRRPHWHYWQVISNK
jgi:hypothetical protein